MKRIGLLLAAVVVLASCPFSQDSYDKLIETWGGTQPSDWAGTDRLHIFSADRTLRFLVYNNGAPIEDTLVTITGCSDSRITATDDPGDPGMVMCYRFTNAADTTMDFGWVDTASGQETYYLQMAKQ